MAICANSGQTADARVLTGAEQTGLYLSRLTGRTLAVAANPTSTVGGTHLVDFLLSRNIAVKAVFAPEHGFRGEADAGEHVADGLDAKTGLPVISLYGSHQKPTADDLRGIDLVLFDIQDVGVRFYTYISTLHLIMEACAENGVPLLVLDRPNPNGFYLDGPVLDPGYRSFVGMHPVPVVHGMTIGEYAQMVNGEGWLAGGARCRLEVVPCRNYTHRTHYRPPVKPSPNLPTYRSILLYPTLCFFEGTAASVARGTDFPFEAVGHPDYRPGGFTFTPRSMDGAKHPPFQDQPCRGRDFRGIPVGQLESRPGIDPGIIIDVWRACGGKSDFFNPFFTQLAGGPRLREQIEQGMTADAIRETWRPGLEQFRQIRQKYLLYPDF